MACWTGHAGRWARCRNAHLSLFARQVNLGLQGHRGLASCPTISRICSELRPISGFVEQRSKIPGALDHFTSGEAPEDIDGAAVSLTVAALLEEIAGCTSDYFLSEMHTKSPCLSSVESLIPVQGVRC
eukprot:TRINITY_DN15168_c0_g1_i1.p1 TRINITY_DN15168_c0_g1~~TRINITY_DN15168_c0_g1_i1.p1  ORF type:complete len:128 (-),score=9.95 TRINITY_DN15168_c0_g1_i1:115-498(-)